MRLRVLLIVLDCRGISRLQVFQTSRLDLDQAAIWMSVVLRLLGRSLAGASGVGGHFGMGSEHKWSEGRIVEGVKE